MEKKKKSKKIHQCLIVFGAHICMFLCAGIYRSFGVFIVEFKKYFGTSLVQVSAIASVLSGSFLMSGFISGPLIARVGSPVAILIGTLIMVSGTIASVFAQNALTLCFTLGMFSGMGIGIVYTAAQVIAAYHFKKGYSKANSIISSGAGIGIIVLSPLLQLGIDYYGWRGTMLLLAALQSHLIVISMIMRHVNRMKSEQDEINPSLKHRNSSVSLQSLQRDGNDLSLGSDARIHRRTNQTQHDLQNAVIAELEWSPQECKTVMTICGHGMVVEKSQDSEDDDVDPSTRKLTSIKECETEVTVFGDEFEGNDQNVEVQIPIGNSAQSDMQKLAQVESSYDKHDRVLFTCGEELGENSANLEVGNLTDSAVNKEQNPTVVGSPPGGCEPSREKLLEKSPVDSVSLEDASGSRARKNNWKARVHRLLQTSGWGLFRESIGFSLTMLIQMTLGMCYTAIMVHFVASAFFAGIDRQLASFLLSAVGIGSFASRLGNGWLIDHKLILPEHLYILSMMVFGGSTIISRASSAYGWLMFIAVMLGMSSGVFKSLLPVVLRKYVGVENLPGALGTSLVFMAVGDLLGPVFAGALYDATESYNVPFFVAGAMLFATSLLLFLERPLSRCKEKHLAVNGTKDKEMEKKMDKV